MSFKRSYSNALPPGLGSGRGQAHSVLLEGEGHSYGPLPSVSTLECKMDQGSGATTPGVPDGSHLFSLTEVTLESFPLSKL